MTTLRDLVSSLRCVWPTPAPQTSIHDPNAVLLCGGVRVYNEAQVAARVASETAKLRSEVESLRREAETLRAISEFVKRFSSVH